MSWAARNRRRCELIDREVDGTIDVHERLELDSLQAKMLARRHREAPLPLRGIRKLRDGLVREVSARRPGGRRLRRARLRKKWLKHCAAVLSVHASIMRHPYDKWSPEEKRRLKPAEAKARGWRIFYSCRHDHRFFPRLGWGFSGMCPDCARECN